MQLEQNPFFRKTITSWYDSNFVCWFLIGVMLFVFAFALAGMMVAAGEPDFVKHVWFPGFLLFLSGFLVLKVFIRLRLRSQND
jgi:p-aminobenzoyl-glutamate transporter AbgT